MKKQITFEAIDCKKQLPQESGFYQTEIGLLYFVKTFNKWVTGFTRNPTHWYRKID